jgi:hypothetical protein
MRLFRDPATDRSFGNTTRRENGCHHDHPKGAWRSHECLETMSGTSELEHLAPAPLYQQAAIYHDNLDEEFSCKDLLRPDIRIYRVAHQRGPDTCLGAGGR